MDVILSGSPLSSDMIYSLCLSLDNNSVEVFMSLCRSHDEENGM